MFWRILQEIHVRHERLKNYVHNGFRYPLPPMGQAAMGFFYFLIPVVGGWHVMQWAIARAHDSIGERGENLAQKQIQGIGRQRVTNDGEKFSVGAGGWGGGVRLSESDEETQEKNKRKLLRFLKQQQKKTEDEQQ